METQETKSPSVLNIPTAIIIAAAIIAGAVIWTQKPSPAVVPANEATASLQDAFKNVSADDHIFGNPNARVKIVEYSDTSCPFCKIFHGTMKKIMDTYGKTGDVAWIYRHFPIDKHPNAHREAEALECAGALGGNEKFWAYTNRLYDITPAVTQSSPNGLDQKELPKIAEFVGLNVEDFNSCLASGKYKDKIDQDYKNGLAIGIQGTPSSVMVTPKGTLITIEGAQQFDTLKQAIDALLAENPREE